MPQPQALLPHAFYKLNDGKDFKQVCLPGACIRILTAVTAVFQNVPCEFEARLLHRPFEAAAEGNAERPHLLHSDRVSTISTCLQLLCRISPQLLWTRASSQSAAGPSTGLRAHCRRPSSSTRRLWISTGTRGRHRRGWAPSHPSPSVCWTIPATSWRRCRSCTCRAAALGCARWTLTWYA